MLVLPAVLLVLALAGFELTTAGTYTVDTGQLVGGLAVADHCLDGGKLTKCGLSQTQYYCSQNTCGRAANYTSVGPFPVIQYIPGWILKHLGASPQGVVRGLVVLSGLATLLVLLLAVRVGAAVGRRQAALAAVCILASPLIWYSHSGFGEALVAGVLTAFVVAILRGWHPVVLALLACAATITKDTSGPFVIALAAIAWISLRRRPTRGQVVGLAAGLVAGIAAVAAFNVFRFGSPFNLFYGSAVLHTPVSDRPERFLALLFAPNGGLLWFWPAALLVLVSSLVIAVRRAGWSRALLLEPAVLSLGLLVALLAGLASWFSSFGWAAWGPRLAVPWIPPVIVILIATYGRELVDAWSRRRAAAIAAAALVVVLSIAHLGVLFDSGRHRHEYPFGARVGEIAYSAGLVDTVCPHPAIIQVSRSHYFHCSRHAAWDSPYVLRKATANVLDREPGPGLLYVVALLGLLTIVVRREPEPRLSRAG